MSYDPEAGDAVWLDFTPHAGHEMAGRHPAIVLTPRRYHIATGLALVVPVTTKAKGGSFEVPIRGAKRLKGVALANELRSIDYEARQAEKFDICPGEALARIRDIGETLLRSLEK